MVVLGAKAVLYEGKRTTHSLYFCFYMTLVIHEQTVDVEKEDIVYFGKG